MKRVPVLLVLFAILLSAPPARAQLALDRLIADFAPDGPSRQDIQVTNQGDKRLFVVITPRRVLDPGTAKQKQLEATNPEELGLLVTPNRMILEPGQTRLLRIAPLPKATETDRIFRISVRPVIGRNRPKGGGLHIVVGYQILAIVRPEAAKADIASRREGRALILTNRGNSNALLFNGQQCNADGAGCVDLPARRLYAGNSWRLDTRYETPVQYYVKFGDRSTVRVFE